MAVNLAEGLMDRTIYLSAQRDLVDRRDGTSRDLQELETVLSSLAPLPDDVVDKVVTVTEDMDLNEWRALVSRVPRRVEVHPDHVTLVPVISDAVTTARQNHAGAITLSA